MQAFAQTKNGQIFLARVGRIAEALQALAEAVARRNDDRLAPVTLKDPKAPEGAGVFIRPSDVVGVTISGGTSQSVEIFTKAGTRLNLPLSRVRRDFLNRVLPEGGE